MSYNLGPSLRTGQKYICPHCGHMTNAAMQGGSEIDPVRLPQPDDALLCINCGEFSLVTTEHKLRKPTEDEIFEMATNADIKATRDLWARAMKKDQQHDKPPKTNPLVRQVGPRPGRSN